MSERRNGYAPIPVVILGGVSPDGRNRQALEMLATAVQNNGGLVASPSLASRRAEIKSAQVAIAEGTREYPNLLNDLSLACRLKKPTLIVYLNDPRVKPLPLDLDNQANVWWAKYHGYIDEARAIRLFLELSKYRNPKIAWDCISYKFGFNNLDGRREIDTSNAKLKKRIYIPVDEGLSTNSPRIKVTDLFPLELLREDPTQRIPVFLEN